MPLCAFPGSSNLLRLGEEVTMATLSRVKLWHLSHWSSQWNPFTGELVGGTIDRAAVRETQHGNHATQMCPLAHWATMHIQQTVHVTQRHSYLHQSRQKLWRTVTCDARCVIFSLISLVLLTYARFIGLLIREHLRYRYPPPGKRAMARC